ncbi:hypothetical protein AUJ78_00250 [Candidatus Peregrinibacteria bacterium CG1_02_41_10]|nr:MAG: hypothetical protein AUJ78_00250 [Candidatus Peregrinibacteria bacterium CG1_02_41_10]
MSNYGRLNPEESLLYYESGAATSQQADLTKNFFRPHPQKELNWLRQSKPQEYKELTNLLNWKNDIDQSFTVPSTSFNRLDEKTEKKLRYKYFDHLVEYVFWEFLRTLYFLDKDACFKTSVYEDYCQHIDYIVWLETEKKWLAIDLTTKNDYSEKAERLGQPIIPADFQHLQKKTIQMTQTIIPLNKKVWYALTERFLEKIKQGANPGTVDWEKLAGLEHQVELTQVNQNIKTLFMNTTLKNEITPLQNSF